MSSRRMTIDLEKFHEDGLRHLAGIIPHENKEQLLKIVLSRGLVELLKSEFERISELRSQEPSLAARAVVRPFPAPSVLYKRKHRKQIEQAEADVGLAMAPEKPAGGSPRPVPPRHVGKTLSVQVPVALRQPLANFLDAHPEMSEAEALTNLLQRALGPEEAVENRTETESQRKSTAMLRLAEDLYLRARRYCLA